jgi:ribosomal subunit interface protein
MDIEIQAIQVDVQPEWRALIEARLARLAERHPKLARVHVRLKHGGHHRVGSEEVDVVANGAGATFSAAKRGERMLDAAHAALDALERELAEHYEARRDARRAPLSRPAGAIA